MTCRTSWRRRRGPANTSSARDMADALSAHLARAASAPARD
jgi:hypothetical protein